MDNTPNIETDADIRRHQRVLDSPWTLQLQPGGVARVFVGPAMQPTLVFSVERPNHHVIAALQYIVAMHNSTLTDEQREAHAAEMERQARR